MWKILALSSSFFMGNVALACKPCPTDSLGYALGTNDFVLIGKAIEIGPVPADIIARNADNKNMWNEESYSVPVTIEVEEIIVADGEHRDIKKGDLFKTKSHNSPPCKGLVLPKLGARSVFFPKDYGNCSQFVYEIIGGKIGDRTLEDIRLVSPKRRP